MKKNRKKGFIFLFKTFKFFKHICKNCELLNYLHTDRLTDKVINRRASHLKKKTKCIGNTKCNSWSIFNILLTFSTINCNSEFWSYEKNMGLYQVHSQMRGRQWFVIYTRSVLRTVSWLGSWNRPRRISWRPRSSGRRRSRN